MIPLKMCRTTVIRIIVRGPMQLAEEVLQVQEEAGPQVQEEAGQQVQEEAGQQESVQKHKGPC
jgi:hypothetical protein